MKGYDLGEQFAKGVSAMAEKLTYGAKPEEISEFWDAFNDWFAENGYPTK